MKYKYIVTYSAVEREVAPLGCDKLKTVGEETEGRIFLRKKLDGKLIFTNSDYAYFKAIDDDATGKCAEISLRIEQSCDNGNTYTAYWYGYFSTTDGEFDIDRCLFTVEAEPDDDYRCFIEGSKTELSFNNMPGQITTYAQIPDVDYEYYVCRDTVGNCNAGLPDPAPNDTWLPFHTETIGDEITTIFYRQVSITACEDGVAVEPVGTGWYQVTDVPPSCADQGLSKWVREPQSPVTYNPNPDVRAGICDNGTPKQATILSVQKLSSPVNPKIVGKSKIFYVSGAGTTEYYYVKYPKVGATYSWNITGAGNSITSGAGTSAIVVNLVLAGSVTLAETATCGASSLITQAFTICATGGCSEYNSEVELIDATGSPNYLTMCVGETKRFRLNGETGKQMTILGDSTGGATLTAISTGQGTHGEVEITAGPNAGTISGDFGATSSRDSLTFPTTVFNITVAELNIIENIYGSESVCNSDVTKYSILPTDKNSYQWVVDGGSITSGQGTNEITVTWDGINGYGTVAILNSSPCGCNWLMVADCGYNGEHPFFLCRDNSETFSINFLLQSVINKIKDTICPAIDDVRSDYFQWNSVGDTPGFISGTNYVTQDINRLKYPTIAPTYDIIHISDILAGSKQFDTKEKVSWEFLEGLLFEVFNCYWFIENGYLRIEHYSWFLRSVTFDLTVGNYLQYIKGKNIYSYDKIKAPRFERFKWQQALNTDFVGAEISYSGTCVNRDPLTNVKQKGQTDVTTDIIYLLSGDNNVSDNGFTLMVNDYDGVRYTLLEEAGLITGISKPNAHLSWANLHYNYHRHGRVLLEGRMNIQDQTFLSAVRYKQQEGVKFPFCCADTLNPMTDLIRTSVGDGAVIKYEFSFKDDTITVDLAHE